jgi:hypothetical protein
MLPSIQIWPIVLVLVLAVVAGVALGVLDLRATRRTSAPSAKAEPLFRTQEEQRRAA